jgi:hypothetical protein
MIDMNDSSLSYALLSIPTDERMPWSELSYQIRPRNSAVFSTLSRIAPFFLDSRAEASV